MNGSRVIQPEKAANSYRKTIRRLWRDFPLYMMMIPGALFFIVFKYIPMYGVVMAFQNFRMARGFFRSDWIGWANFEKVFASAFFPVVMRNTITISLYKILIGFPVPILIALMLNELHNKAFKKTMQTVMYMPHFISWIVVSSLVSTFFSSSTGVLAQITGHSIDWLVNPGKFRGILVVSDIWKNAGWGTIIYMAALSGINSELYEAADMEGANRFQQTIYITLPSIWPTVLTMFILRIGGIMDAGFEQVLVMQNSSVYMVSEILGTYAYERGYVNAEYGFGAAVNLIQSAISFILVILVNYLSSKSGEGRLW